jgi:Asp-tRNA(Asn)/Glu-tRNA(Gln) amidotransferase B subunit
MADLAFYATAVLVIAVGVCLGMHLHLWTTCVFGWLWDQLQKLLKAIKNLKKKKEIDEEAERIREAVQALMKTKPAKVDDFKNGNKKVVDYFESKIKVVTNNPRTRSIIIEELKK